MKELKLPSFLREYGKMAVQCASEGVDHPSYLLRLAELELIDRHQRMVERRIRAARFPGREEPRHLRLHRHPSVNKALVMELARCEYVQSRENVIAVGNSGTGKPTSPWVLRQVQQGLVLASGACPWASPRLLNLQRQLSRISL